MNDFEVHHIGTSKELQMTRELIVQLKQVTDQYGIWLLPQPARTTFQNILKFYDNILEKEDYEGSTSVRPTS